MIRLQIDGCIDRAARILADGQAFFLRRFVGGLARPCPCSVDPEIAHDPVAPAVEPSARLPLVARSQCTFDRGLRQIVGIGGIAAERMREPTQPRQQGGELVLER